jgi:hypothetical protein
LSGEEYQYRHHSYAGMADGDDTRNIFSALAQGIANFRNSH